jgi:hypothetical protein
MAKKKKTGSSWPIINFTLLDFKPEFSPFVRVLLLAELVLVGLCVLISLALTLLKAFGYLN